MEMDKLTREQQVDVPKDQSWRSYGTQDRKESVVAGQKGRMDEKDVQRDGGSRTNNKESISGMNDMMAMLKELMGGTKQMIQKQDRHLEELDAWWRERKDIIKWGSDTSNEEKVDENVVELNKEREDEVVDDLNKEREDDDDDVNREREDNVNNLGREEENDDENDDVEIMEKDDENVDDENDEDEKMKYCDDSFKFEIQGCGKVRGDDIQGCGKVVGDVEINDVGSEEDIEVESIGELEVEEEKVINSRIEFPEEVINSHIESPDVENESEIDHEKKFESEVNEISNQHVSVEDKLPVIVVEYEHSPEEENGSEIDHNEKSDAEVKEIFNQNVSFENKFPSIVIDAEHCLDEVKSNPVKIINPIPEAMFEHNLKDFFCFSSYPSGSPGERHIQGVEKSLRMQTHKCHTDCHTDCHNDCHIDCCPEQDQLDSMLDTSTTIKGSCQHPEVTFSPLCAEIQYC